ncbi:MAG: hypothetical protein H0X40_05755 [Chthoniobacterales bacterium]|nr:hypothetical protein [Chthoniobacterales bacterium]
MRFPSFVLLGAALAMSACSNVPTLPKGTPPTTAGYTKVMEDRLGPIWYRMVAADQKRTVGTVKLTFEASASGGHVRNLKIVSNDAGPADERIARAAVERLRLPPIPGAILQKENKHFISCEESFTIYQNPEPAPSPTAKKR